MKKLLLTTAAFVALGTAGAAMAENANRATEPTMTERAREAVNNTADSVRETVRDVTDGNTAKNATGLSAISDAHIVNAAGEKVGEVEDVLIDSTGNVVAIAAEVGGALRMDNDVVIDMESLTYRNGQFVTSMSAEQLKALPDWKD